MFSSSHESFSFIFCQAVICPVNIFFVNIALYLTTRLFAGYTLFKMKTLLTSLKIRFVNNAVSIVFKAHMFKLFSCRADVTVTLIVVDKFVVVKIRVTTTTVALMTDTWCYVLLVKVLVIFSCAVSFVSDDSLDFF